MIVFDQLKITIRICMQQWSWFKILFGIVSVGLLILLQIFWLIIPFGMFSGLIFLWNSKAKLVVLLKEQQVLKISIQLVFIFFIALFIRIFLLSIANIPSSSMENTLGKGDKILISKLSYGPRIPRSLADLPWLHPMVILFEGYEAYHHKKTSKTPYKRLAGYQKVKRNDIITFDSPTNTNTQLIKRCIGLPGDTLQILEGTIYINHQEIPNSPTYKERQRIYSGKAPVYGAVWKSFLEWYPDNLGPLIIPYQGMKIQLTTSNRAIYDHTSQNHITFSPFESAFAGKKDSHIFNQDYFFVIGDNRDQSHDSRFWGFLPKNAIRGKAVLGFSKGTFKLLSAKPLEPSN